MESTPHIKPAPPSFSHPKPTPPPFPPPRKIEAVLKAALPVTVKQEFSNHDLELQMEEKAAREKIKQQVETKNQIQTLANQEHQIQAEKSERKRRRNAMREKEKEEKKKKVEVMSKVFEEKRICSNYKQKQMWDQYYNLASRWRLYTKPIEHNITTKPFIITTPCKQYAFLLTAFYPPEGHQKESRMSLRIIHVPSKDFIEWYNGTEMKEYPNISAMLRLTVNYRKNYVSTIARLIVPHVCINDFHFYDVPFYYFLDRMNGPTFVWV
jgi:hypothetical protein